MTFWTEEKDEELCQLLQLFPRGSCDRWNQIASTVHASVSSCKTRAKDLHTRRCCPETTTTSPKKVLMLGGLGHFEFSSDPCLKAIADYLEKQDDVSVNKMEFNPSIPLDSYHAVIAITPLNYADPELYQDTQWKRALKIFVEKGGMFIILAGEQNLLFTNIVKKVFGLTWKQSAYCRETNTFNREKTLSWLPRSDPIFSQFPTTYNTKSIRLDGVVDAEQVYKGEGEGPDAKKCPVALAHFGHGKVAYIGDVNWQEETMKIIHSFLQIKSRMENSSIDDEEEENIHRELYSDNDEEME